MFGRKKEPTPQQDYANKHGLEAGWYLPPNPDPYSERTPADLAEEARLLSSEDFFALTGLAMGQIDKPEAQEGTSDPVPPSAA